MLVEEDLENKFFDKDGVIDTEELREECRCGVSLKVRYRVYKLLMLSLGYDYTLEAENGNVDGYQRLCDQTQSEYPQSKETKYGISSSDQTKSPFDLLISVFPEYFTSKDKSCDFLFVPDSKEDTDTSVEQEDTNTSVAHGKAHRALRTRKLLSLDPEKYKRIYGKINENKNIKQIHKDVPRIPEEFRILKLNEEYDVDVSYIYENVLILYTELFETPYLQGTFGLVVPFVYSFVTYDCTSEDDLERVEANTFLCYARMVKGVKKDIDDTWESVLKKIHEELKSKEPSLYDHFYQNDVFIDGILIKWLCSFFFEGFAFDRSLRIFDFMISYEPEELPDLMVYLCVGIFGYYKDEFLASDQEKCMRLIHQKGSSFTMEAGPKEIERIVKKARHYMNEKSKKTERLL